MLNLPLNLGDVSRASGQLNDGNWVCMGLNFFRVDPYN
jgi:hypothetical protein